jgi:murein DD-endopeptidase MepM/ murein hydrolase activator NlpD
MPFLLYNCGMRSVEKGLLVSVMVLALLGVGCAGGGDRTARVPAEAVVVQTPIETRAPPQQESVPTSTLDMPAPPLSATAAGRAAAQAVATVPVATATPLDVGICSPLAEHDLSSLAAIISSAYTAPPVGREERHHGVDFSYYQNGLRQSIEGEVVQAVLGGRVALLLKESFPYGNAVLLETGIAELPRAWGEAVSDKMQAYALASQGTAAGSLYFLYAHLEDVPALEAGQRIDACTPLGAVGKSGNAGVAHLHLEMRLGPANAQLEDMGYYLYEITPQQRESYLRWRTSGEFQHFDPMALLTLK